jgi:hypothetical protein
MNKKIACLSGAVALVLSGCAAKPDRDHDPYDHGSHGMKLVRKDCNPQAAACHVEVSVVIQQDGRCIAAIGDELHVFGAGNIHFRIKPGRYSFPASSPPTAIFFKDVGQTQLSHVTGGGPNQVTIHDKHSDAVAPGNHVTYKYGVRVKDDQTNTLCAELDPPIINEY